MAEEDSIEPTENKYDADDDSSSDEEGDYDYSDDEQVYDNKPESNIKLFEEALEIAKTKKRPKKLSDEELYDFPKDTEKWTEQDLQEIWGDGPLDLSLTGWDPAWADSDDLEFVEEEIEQGNEPDIAPFYVPYRKSYPVVPDNHHDISKPKAVIEELDRIEEFLKWVSYIFVDGSSYEGTVWDDYAHGKGVYVAERGLLRYEGEWLQNQMEGHGVIEVDVPAREPVPGSKLEAKMRAEGKIISRDFMSPEDREWLEMDIEDSYRLADGDYEIPFDESCEWIELFGKKPEQGRYRYAGQWKHGRMHGCGVYEVNERPLFGRFYFGVLLEDSTGCDEDVSTLHAGIAEVAAAKARMFVNKPDGMVREERGPYNDPQHPYLYEGEDVWMAPGFINQFYEVPDYWKTYVHEVDEEREMWLNSFYKAPLRIPMPAELEHWWSKDEDPEFVLVNCDPEPDPEDPSRLVYTKDPLILHTPTGRLINFVEDEKYGVRLFWQPPLKEGEEVEEEEEEEELEELDTDKLNFLPLGFDEFFGRTTTRAKKKEGGVLERLTTSVENVWKPVTDKLAKWAEEKKKDSEMKLKLIEKELELIEVELSLEETLEDMEMELKREEKEEDRKMETSQNYGKDTSVPIENYGLDAAEDNEDEDDDDDDDDAPTSFGSVATDQDSKENGKENKRGKSPFSTLSLSFAPCNLVSSVPLKLQESFASWKNGRCPRNTTIFPQSSPWNSIDPIEPSNSVSFPLAPIRRANLKTNIKKFQQFHKRNIRLSPLHSISWISSNSQASSGSKISQRKQRSKTQNQQQRRAFKVDLHDILSLHFPIDCPGT